jgi:hypothetical protein
MKFASTRQIVLMIVVSAAVLYVLDFWKNPQLWHNEVAASASGLHGNAPELTLWINAPCLARC